MNPVNVNPKFVALKDVAFSPFAVIAFGKMTVPATMQTPEFYAISVWLNDVKEPLMITYETAEERDAQLLIIKESVEAV